MFKGKPPRKTGGASFSGTETELETTVVKKKLDITDYSRDGNGHFNYIQVYDGRENLVLMEHGVVNQGLFASMNTPAGATSNMHSWLIFLVAVIITIAAIAGIVASIYIILAGGYLQTMTFEPRRLMSIWWPCRSIDICPVDPSGGATD